MVIVKGPKFRSANIYPNRKLDFKYRRRLPFGKRGVNFRKTGVKFRGRGVTFSNDGVSNIDIKSHDDPINLNNKGVEYYNKGKYKLALKYFEKALDVAPQFDTARINREYCFKMLREKHRRKELFIQQKRAYQQQVRFKTGKKIKAPTTQPNQHTIDYNRDTDHIGRLCRDFP